MSVKQSSAYCNVCGRQSLFAKPRINHILHLILSIVTFGFWLIVWIVLGITNSAKRPRCVTCGSEMALGGSLRSAVPHQQAPAQPPAPVADPYTTPARIDVQPLPPGPGAPSGD